MPGNFQITMKNMHHGDGSLLICILRAATLNTFLFPMISIRKSQFGLSEDSDVLILYAAEGYPSELPDTNKSCKRTASLQCESSCVSQGQHFHKSSWSKMGTSNCEP